MIKLSQPKGKSSYSIDEKGMIDLACSLISKKTINPPGNEYLIKDIVVKSMEELGMKVKIMGDKTRPNILGEVGNGYPRIAILCHMDVVPPGRGWKTDPFKPIIKNGRLYGRGACDDKGPYAASWAAVKAVLKNGNLKGKIILGAVADEERGSNKGIKLLLNKKKLDCDFCFIPDGGRMNEVVIGEKGMLWLKFVSIGKSAHGSNPEKGVNAIKNMMEFLANVSKLKINKKIDRHFTPMTINLGEIKGGDAPNIVPSYCEATIDIRYPLGVKKEDIMRKIKASMNSFNRNAEITVLKDGDECVSITPQSIGKISNPLEFLKNSEDKVPGILRIPRGKFSQCLTLRGSSNKGGKIILKEILQDTSPHLLDIHANPFLKTFLETSKEMKENLPASQQAGMKFVTIGGNSVGKILYFAGIPSFSHSPEDIPTAHQANESVSLRNLKKCAILWANFLDKIVGG